MRRKEILRAAGFATVTLGLVMGQASSAEKPSCRQFTKRLTPGVSEQIGQSMVSLNGTKNIEAFVAPLLGQPPAYVEIGNPLAVVDEVPPLFGQLTVLLVTRQLDTDIVIVSSNCSTPQEPRESN